MSTHTRTSSSLKFEASLREETSSVGLQKLVKILQLCCDQIEIQDAGGNSKNSTSNWLERKASPLKNSSSPCTNLKRVPALRNRYVGGGEARAFDACLSRLSIISLWMWKRLLIKNSLVNMKPHAAHLNRLSCMLAWYDGGGGRCWNSGYSRPNDEFPRAHCLRPHRPVHWWASDVVIRQATPLIVTKTIPTPE